MGQYAYKYFTGAQTVLSINGIDILEASGISGTLSVPHLPIYGYASDLYDSIAHGKVIVSGELAINYVFDGYLYAIINKAKNSIAPSIDKKKVNTANINNVEYKMFNKANIESLKKTYWASPGRQKNSIRREFLSSVDISVKDFRLGTSNSIGKDGKPIPPENEEKIITGVTFSGNTVVRNTSEGHIQEIYQFIARNII